MSQTTGHTMGPCGCYAKSEYAGASAHVVYCPTHAQAPAMRAVLARSVRIITGQPTSTEALDEANVEHFLTEARAILRAIEGVQTQ